MEKSEGKNIAIFGCGVNSVAMMIEIVRRKVKIDFVLFANTGGWSNLGEKHDTYRYKRFFSKWLKSVGYPEIKTVVYNSEGLYRELVRLGTLPSIAFDYKTCSQKWKIAASDKYLKFKGILNRKKIIGYDFGESYRSNINYSENGTSFWYPLVEWQLDRIDCVKLIIDAGFPLPPKSSCFFCPNMKDYEIHKLKKEDPCRFEKAIELEENAQKRLTSVRGLGRKKKWSEIITQPFLPIPDDEQFELEKMPCSCSL